MINEMRAHTRRQAIRLGLIMSLFLLLASAFAVLLRYRGQTLDSSLAQYETVRSNLTVMRNETASIRDIIASLGRLLPNGHGTSSAELLLFSRLDDIKSKLPAGEMTVRTPEHKEEMLTLEFVFKPASANSYSALINTLGVLEQQIDPFVSVNRITLEGSTKEKPGPLVITVEGTLAARLKTEEQNAEPAPAPVPPPSPATGRNKS